MENLHKAIRQIYSQVNVIYGDTKEKIIAKDKNYNEVSIDWDKVETKATEIETAKNLENKNKENKKTSGKQKLKDLGLDDDEIKALLGV
jgi:hypothetical protein